MTHPSSEVKGSERNEGVPGAVTMLLTARVRDEKRAEFFNMKPIVQFSPRRREPMKTIASITLLLLLSGVTAHAQEQPQGGGTGGDLAQQARNPTAALTMMTIVGSHNPGFHNLDSANQTRLVLMPVIPFKTGKLQHIARITLPWVINAPDWAAPAIEDSNVLPPNYVPTADITGLSDMALFDLLIFPAPWKGGRIAAGVSAIIPTATDPALGTEKWSVGPAFGGLMQSGSLLVGGIVLANFSVAGKEDRDNVSAMTIQPFGSYGLGSGWSIEMSEMNFNYSFESKAWGSIPLGARVGKLVTFGSLPVRFYGDAEYNFADTGVAPKWTFRFAVVPLL